MEEGLGVIRPPLQVRRQQPASFLVLAQIQICGARFAQDFTQVVLFILAQHGLKVRQRFGEASLFASYAAQLKVRVGFRGIDGYGVLESLNGRGILASLLVNQPELVLRRAVVRIDRRRVQHAPEILLAA